MDYLTVSENRSASFKEFMEEWIVDQFVRTLAEFGLKKPWYWDIFLDELETYHHMLYATAYTYRGTLWFDVVMPGPAKRKWLREKYPKHWPDIDPVWDRIARKWRDTVETKAGEMSMHATALLAFCDLCQFPLAAGTPCKNTATTLEHNGQSYIFCSQPCRWIFLREPERYVGHKGLVKRVISGEAPENLKELLTDYFQLTPDTWGKDAYAGRYEWSSVERDPI